MVTRAELKAKAKEQIKGNILTIFIITIVMSLILGLCAIPVVGWIAALFVTPAFEIALCGIFLGLTKGEKAEVGALFSKFSQAGTGFLAWLLQEIYVMLWSCLFVIPGIMKAYSYSMTWYVLADHPEMGANEAITKSKEIMQGHRMELFILQLSFIGWALLGSITFGLAYIYVIPYMETTIANFYNEIKGE